MVGRDERQRVPNRLRVVEPPPQMQVNHLLNPTPYQRPGGARGTRPEVFERRETGVQLHIQPHSPASQRVLLQAQITQSRHNTPFQQVEDVLQHVRNFVNNGQIPRVTARNLTILDLFVDVTHGRLGQGRHPLHFHLPAQPLGSITVDQIFDILESQAAQSMLAWDFDSLIFTFQFARPPFRGGAFNGTLPSYLSHRERCFHLFHKQKDGTECGQRILAAITYVGNMRDILRADRKRQLQERVQLVKSWLPHDDMMSLEDFSYLLNERQELWAWRIVVLGINFNLIKEMKGRYFDRIVEDGDGYENHAKKTCYIMYDERLQHYFWCRFSTYFGKNKHYWCHRCLKQKPSNGTRRHRCVTHDCPNCQKRFATAEECRAHIHGPIDRTCRKCNRVRCFTEECLKQHEYKCRIQPRCRECNKLIKPKQEHRCWEEICDFCEATYAEGEEHICFMEVTEPHEPPDFTKHYAFDFESLFIPHVRHIGDKNITVYEHQVDLVVVQQCNATGQLEDEQPLITFRTIEQFINFCLLPAQEGSTFWAHNLKGYDGRLIYDYLMTTSILPYDCKWRGIKIMGFSIGDVMFRDSMLHMSTSLDKLPEIFDLQFAGEPMKKGFYPFLFNLRENKGYKGPLPARHFFQPQLMKKKKFNDFNLWYDSFQGEYDLDAEYIMYCQQDVRILSAALRAYASNFHNQTSIDPLKKLTLPSACMMNFTTNCLKPNQVMRLTKDMYDFAKRGFHGGRTDVRQALCELTDEQLAAGWAIYYVDVQSLYPFVQQHFAFPTGACTTTYYEDTPEALAEALDYIRLEGTDWCGMVELDVEMIKPDYHPLFVTKCPQRNKLVATCEPIIKEVVTGLEARVALRRPDIYKITRVYRIDHAEADPDLFKKYVYENLRGKIVNSGLPKFIRTEEDFVEFQNQCQQRYGFTPQREEFQKNEGAKQICKLMLNSLWGKFGQKMYSTKQVEIKSNSYATFAQQLQKENDDPVNYQIKRIDQNCNDDLFVHIMDLDDHSGLKSTNVQIAAYTAAAGRVRLWLELIEVGENCLYHDTDSIIYLYKPGEYKIPEGNYLGDWEPETSVPIRKFVGLGPKTRAWETVPDAEGKVHSECKVKGFTLHNTASTIINYQGLKDLLLRREEGYTLSVEQLTFDWLLTKKGGMITFVDEKALGYSYDKGVLDPTTFKIYPFGYSDLVPTPVHTPHVERLFPLDFFDPMDPDLMDYEML